MTEVFDEYGNYIFPSDVPLKEPNYATSEPQTEQQFPKLSYEAFKIYLQMTGVIKGEYK